jgi:hypothetical protein
VPTASRRAMDEAAEVDMGFHNATEDSLVPEMEQVK